jgi:integrase
MANVGLGIEEAQRLLGHQSPVTTQVYYEVTDARLREAARRLRYDRPAPPVPRERGDRRPTAASRHK